MNTEFELKLEVPPARAKAVRAALARLRPESEKLRAVYFDTPERLLQREGLALRLRSENGRWVQTLKGDGRHALERLEHEVAIGPSRNAPRPVAARHADSPAGERLMHVLGRGFDDSAWEPLFETDVRRAKAMASEGASRVEIAFDDGHIVSGRRKAALREIEFELKEGEPRAAVNLARRWCREHGLWLSTISKAQKGVLLASKPGSFGPAAGAADVDFDPHSSSLRRIAGEALAMSLDQVIRNASELAAGSTSDEHIHQMRVGIRRVRTALRELVRQDTAAQEQALVDAFRELGRHRDASHVLGSIESRLRDAGAPPAKEQRHDTAHPARIVRAPAFQDAVLDLLALACELRADDGAAGGAKAQVRRRLAKLRKNSLRDGVKFESVDPSRQHRVRKRLKRLRYLAEFTAPLHGTKARKAYLSKLRKVQDALGGYNDCMAALAHYRDRAAQDAHASFAAGWLQAQREHLAHECGRQLRRFAKSHPFWR